MDKPILVLNNVSIVQDNKQVLSEVNIEINNGEFVYLIGRTGSGKTSLIKSLYFLVGVCRAAPYLSVSRTLSS